jgi:hypothetical protein
MHIPLAAALRSASFDVFTQSQGSFAVRPHSRRHLTLCFWNLTGAFLFGGVCLWGLPDYGMLGFLLANFAGLLASLALLCAVQSVVWLLLQLPSLQIDGSTTTVYLTGWRPIILEQSEIAEVVLRNAGGEKFNVTLELVSPEAVRRGLSVFDRLYFDSRERLSGFGFSHTIALRPDDQAKLVRALRAQFGARVTSQVPEADAAFSEA